MDRIIRVTGKGKISVRPDTIRLNISFEDVKEAYDAALKQSAEQTESLKDCFETLGFSRSDLKTQYFNVDTEYENDQDQNNKWKRRFVGYKYTHRLKIDFREDNERLGKVLSALANCRVHPEFSIEYTVKDIEASKNLLLGKAVADSKQKAEILAQSAGIKLGDIITIDYSWDELNMISKPMNRMMLPRAAMGGHAGTSYNIDIEPDNIDVTDTVTVVWKLE